MDNLDKIGKIVDDYGVVMSKNHLVEEIRAYDRAIKDQDQQYLDMDERLLNNFGSALAQDESLSTQEMQNIFSQQIRKMMSKQVKSTEKIIKANPKGQTSSMVDYIMYASIVFVMAFGYVSYKTLQE